MSISGTILQIVKYEKDISLYIDGNHINSTELDPLLLSNNNATFNLTVGKQFDSYFSGYIQDLRIVKDGMYPDYPHRITDSFEVPQELLPTECFLEPLPCAELHIQSDQESDSVLFIDLSVRDYLINIGAGTPKHSIDVSPVYGASSIKLENTDYLVVNDRFSFLHENTTNWTIQTWVYIEEIQLDPANPAYFLHNAIDLYGIKAYYHPTGYFGFEIWNGQEKVVDMKSNKLQSESQVNQWYHFTVIAKDKEYKLFINGQVADLVRANYVSLDADADSLLNIGNGYTGQDASEFDGYLQDLMIFKDDIDEKHLPPQRAI